MKRVEVGVRRLEKALGLGANGRADSRRVIYFGTEDGRVVALPVTYHENLVIYPHTDGYLYKMRGWIPTEERWKRSAGWPAKEMK